MKKLFKTQHQFALVLLTFTCLFACNTKPEQSFETWNKITIDFQGPMYTEIDATNPFTDHRLDVEFLSPTGKKYLVPGYFAADGKAAETSATSGNIWRVNFTAGETGIWKYTAHFYTGENIAAEFTGGKPTAPIDGTQGELLIIKNTQQLDKKDMRSKGKLVYTGEHFLRHEGSKTYFLKAGANSPEILLEYAEFDGTPSDRLYPGHISEWDSLSPTWKKGKGKGIIGMMNYLSSIDINSYYFLAMNAYGDGKKAWPWIHQDSIVRYDCSKLDQWQILFEHMNNRGILVNMVLSETENETYFEYCEFNKPEGFATSRKIFYREMVARFGYLNGISWDIGEENGWHDERRFQYANSDEQRIEYTNHLRKLTYYEDHISIHNGPSDDDHIFAPLYGLQSLTGPAFQWNFSDSIYEEITTLRDRSAAAKHKWVIFFDEPYINPKMRELDEWRRENVWETYMAGGAGIELYTGAGADVYEDDLHKYEAHYNTMTIARNFFEKHTPFYEMEPDQSVCIDGYALRKNDEVFVIYYKDCTKPQVKLPKGIYNAQWMNTRTGALDESFEFTSIGKQQVIHKPSCETKNDWVVLIEK